MRCKHLYKGLDPQCDLEEGHDGVHMYKCCSPDCPGSMVPESIWPHNGCRERLKRVLRMEAKEQIIRNLIKEKGENNG